MDTTNQLSPSEIAELIRMRSEDTFVPFDTVEELTLVAHEYAQEQAHTREHV